MKRLAIMAYCLIRFGKVTPVTKSVDGGFVSEVAWTGRGGRSVGYWAYGSFDPSLPFGKECAKYAVRRGDID